MALIDMIPCEHNPDRNVNALNSKDKDCSSEPSVMKSYQKGLGLGLDEKLIRNRGIGNQMINCHQYSYRD